MKDDGTPDPSFDRPSFRPETRGGPTARSRRLDDLLANLPATVWTTDTRLVLTFADGVYLRRLELDPAKILGRTIPDILLDGREDHPIVHAHLAALGGETSTVQVDWGGRQFYVRVAPLKNAHGDIVGCTGINLELGPVPEDDETLHESDVRLRRVVDSNMVGMAFGDDQGRILDANDAFLDLVGYAREDLVADGLSWPALLPVEAHPRQVQALEEILATGRCTPFETEVIRRDGSRVPVLVGAARLSARRREGVAFVLDISDRKSRLHRIQAELACADILAEHGASEHAMAEILHVCVSALPWDRALLWSGSTESGHCLGSAGTSKRGAQDLVAVAEAIAAKGTECWTPDPPRFATPLDDDGRCLGALVLSSEASGRIDADLLQSCRRIARRIARYIARS
jgi:PAS domain S-box-containing protein